MTDRITVSDAHRDHYLKLQCVDLPTAVWFDGFTGLALVVTRLGIGAALEVGGPLLVSVVDRCSTQTLAWAFSPDAGWSYIKEKIPAKAFSRVWRQRLAESIQVALRLHPSIEQQVQEARSQ